MKTDMPRMRHDFGHAPTLPIRQQFETNAHSLYSRPSSTLLQNRKFVGFFARSASAKSYWIAGSFSVPIVRLASPLATTPGTRAGSTASRRDGTLRKLLSSPRGCRRPPWSLPLCAGCEIPSSAFFVRQEIVRAAGIEPALCRQNWILSPARLPVPPRPHDAASSSHSSCGATPLWLRPLLSATTPSVKSSSTPRGRLVFRRGYPLAGRHSGL